MLIPNKRAFLAGGLRALGLVALLEGLARRPGLLVLTYHRIGTTRDNPFYDPVFSATPAAFRAEMQLLRARFRIVRLAELVELAERGLPLREPTLLVTFDDGYRDNSEQALPILKELDVPAVFFLPTGFLERPRLTWWDHVAYVVKHTRQTNLLLDLPARLEVDLTSQPPAAAVWKVVEAYLNTQARDDAACLAHLEERAGVNVDSAGLGQALFMTWDQARALAVAGMAIGSHGHDHRNLGQLDEAAQRAELTESKAIIERELGCEVTALAYPYGGLGAFSEVTTGLAYEVGYQLAFTALPGVNRPGRTGRFALARLGVGFADSPNLLRVRCALYGSLGGSIV